MTAVSVHKEELIKFRFRIEEFFEGFVNIAREFFHDLAYISGQSDRIFVKISSQMYPWTTNVPLNFENNPDPQFGSEVRIWIQTPDPDHILLVARTRSLTALVTV